jgi:putative ABC transport system permease protein
LLVIAQIAVGLALLITAGLTSKSFLKLQAEDLGFDPHHADVVDVVLPRGYFDDPVHAGRFYAEVLDRLRQVGIFSSVAAMDDVPLTGEGSKGGFLVKEIPADSPSHWPTAGWHLVSDEYFRTMHIPVLRGRAFLGQGHEAPNVAIVNESLAEQFWSIPDAAGQELAIPGLDDSTYASYRAGKTIWLTIVGVVANVRHNAPGTPAEPEIYLPFFQHPAGTGRLSFVVRTHVAPTNVESRIRTEISSIESQAVVQLTPYDTILQRAVQLPRLRYLLVGIFAGLALLLSALGIYGVVAHAVAQRRHEFAIRTALGARPRHILASALSVGVRLIVIGTPLGVLCGIGGAQLIRSFLYGVGTTDISTLFGSALLLSSITGLTSYLAARQATRVEAAAFLHSE